MGKDITKNLYFDDDNSSCTDISTAYDFSAIHDSISNIMKTITPTLRANIAVAYDVNAMRDMSNRMKEMTSPLLANMSSAYDFSAIHDSISNIMKTITPTLRANVAAAYDVNAMRDMSNRIKEMTSPLLVNMASAHDFSAMHNSIRNLVSQIDNSGGFDMDIFESEDERNDFIEVKEIIKENNNNGAPALNDKQKKIFDTYIYPIILALFIQFFIVPLTSQQSIVEKEVIKNTFNANYAIMEVNKHFTISQGFDRDILNYLGLRFIGREEVCVRIRPNNSSAVVEKLPLGKIVKLVDKNKKWSKITWADENGNSYYGWVQSWKINIFK